MPQVQLFDAMHRNKGEFLQKKRVLIFWGTLVGIFVWEWFPEYIAPCVYIDSAVNQTSELTDRQYAHRYLRHLLGCPSLALGYPYLRWCRR